MIYYVTSVAQKANGDVLLKPGPVRRVNLLLGVRVQCCFTSTETVVTVRDGEPRMATSTFTQLLNSVSVLLYVHRDRTDC